MPLTKPITRFMESLRAFLANEASPLLEVDVSRELEPQAAKLLDAVAAEQDDLLVPLECVWSSGAELCALVATELGEVVAQAKLALGDEEPTRFALPAQMRPADDLRSHEVCLVEYAETIQRALSNHVRRLVIVLALRSEATQRADCATFVRRLTMITGTADLKWIVFDMGTLVIESELPRLRQAPYRSPGNRSAESLQRLALDPVLRVQTLAEDPAGLATVARQIEHHRVVGTQVLAIVLDGISFVSPLFFFTEASRALSRKCAELERLASGGKHVAPLYEEAHDLVGHVDAELYFAEFCERTAKALLKDNGTLLIVLCPNPSTPALGLDASVDLLVKSAVSTRVRYLMVDPRLPYRFDEQSSWGISRASYAIGPDQIEQGMRERLAAPECSLVERLRYTSALSALALAKGDPDTALELSLSVLELAGQSEVRQETTGAWYVLGNTLYQCAAFEPAEQAYAECVDRALDEGTPMLAAQALAGIGHTLFMRSKWDEAIQCYATARTMWCKLGHVHGELYALTWHGESAAQKQDFQVAIERMDEALAICARVDPAQEDAFQASKVELLQRKASVHAKAKQTKQEDACRSEAERLGASQPVCDHP
jgi:tetratricopeptide (TPR) repeat protein